MKSLKFKKKLIIALSFSLLFFTALFYSCGNTKEKAEDAVEEVQEESGSGDDEIKDTIIETPE